VTVLGVEEWEVEVASDSALSRFRGAQVISVVRSVSNLVSNSIA
jgi:hypothetical protein